MRALRAEEIVGNWGTPVLPIRADESIDYRKLADEIEYLIEAKINGIYTNGTAGEFYTQTEEEFVRIHDLLAERCEKSGTFFQIGASHMSPQISLQRIKRSVEWKPGAIQVILSDWFPLQDDEVLDCLQRMEEAADGIGLVLYNPPHAKRVLKPEMYAKIKARIPNLVGIKAAGGDEAWYEAMGQYAAGISIFVPGHQLATGYSRGASGSYSNIACLHPEGAQRWYELMTSDLPRALEIEGGITAFMSAFIVPLIAEQGYCNAACDKLLAAIGGWAQAGTRMRWPYRSVPEEEVSRCRSSAVRFMPDIMANWQGEDMRLC